MTLRRYDSQRQAEIRKEFAEIYREANEYWTSSGVGWFRMLALDAKKLMVHLMHPRDIDDLELDLSTLKSDFELGKDKLAKITNA